MVLRFDAPPPPPDPDGFAEHDARPADVDPNRKCWECLGADCRSFDALARTFYKKANDMVPIQPMLMGGGVVAACVVVRAVTKLQVALESGQTGGWLPHRW